MSLSVALAYLSAAGFWPWLCDVSLKSAAVLLAAAGLGVCLRRASAAWQHLLWSATVVGLVLLPFASAALPRWSLSLPASWLSNADSGEVALLAAASPANEPIGVLDAAFAPATTLAPLPSSLPNASAPETLGLPASAPTGAAWKLNGRSLLAALWACGIVAALMPLAIGLASLRRLRRTSRVLADGPASAALRLLQAQCGLRRRIGLVESSSREIPLTWGVLRPVIVLPADSRSWPAERLRAVLLHELAHIARCDWLTQLAAEVVRAIHWFNPLAWLAVHKVRVLQELACDDRVLGVGLAAADYAEQLLTVTSGRRVGRTLGAACLAMGRQRRLESRLQAILDPDRNRRMPSRRRALVSLAVALAALVSLASANLRLATAELAPDEPAANKSEPGEPSAPAEPVAQEQSPAKGDAIAKDEPALKQGAVLDVSTLKARELEDARRQILTHFYRKTLDGQSLTEGAVKGMLAALNDPYSQYLSPEEMRQLVNQVQGKLVGIGVRLGPAPASPSAKPSADDDEASLPTVITPLDDSPALKAGVRAGDIILAIDGQSTEGLKLDEVVRRIAGVEGSVVRLMVRHADGEEAELKIRRWPLSIPTVEGVRRDARGRWDFWLDSEAKIAYARLSQLGENTVGELDNALAELGRDSLKGLVLDLRWCPGGSLAASVDLCKLFLSNGAIVAVKKLGEPEQAFQADRAAPFAELPLVVLVNEQTASAAEIVAGSLQDRGRAIVVGSRTFGKGSVQSIVSLGDEGAGIKLTTAYFVLPSGRNLDRHSGGEDWGVEPNDGFYVPLGANQVERLLARRQDREILRIEKDAKSGALERLTPQRVEGDFKEFADPQLAAALKTMLARLATGEFLKVGGSKHDAAQLQQKELVLRQKRQIERELDRLQRELAELERADAAAEPATKQ